MPRCSAIVVTYNSAASIGSCLEALAAEECEIIVVDNASQDNTVSRVQEVAARHEIQLLRISRNLGFGAGVNQGARAASGEVLLILNPDAVTESGSIRALVDCFRSTDAAAVGGSLLTTEGQPQRGFAFRRLPTVTSLIFEVLLINHLWPGNPVNRRYRCLDADYSLPQQVEQPAGACLAVTREGFEAIGGFDPCFYPVWFEDVDLCKRLLDSGRKIVFCPGAHFRHSGAHSVNQLSFEQKQLYWYSNMERYAEKHFSRMGRFILSVAIIKGMTLRWLATLFGAKQPGVSPGQARATYREVIKKVLEGSRKGDNTGRASTAGR